MMFATEMKRRLKLATKPSQVNDSHTVLLTWVCRHLWRDSFIMNILIKLIELINLISWWNKEPDIQIVLSHIAFIVYDPLPPPKKMMIQEYLPKKNLYFPDKFPVKEDNSLLLLMKAITEKSRTIGNEWVMTIFWHVSTLWQIVTIGCLKYAR